MGQRGSFWWRSIIHLLDTFKGIATVQIGNGETIHKQCGFHIIILDILLNTTFERI
jgi:hypothetical protein